MWSQTLLSALLYITGRLDLSLSCDEAALPTNQLPHMCATSIHKHKHSTMQLPNHSGRPSDNVVARNAALVILN